MVKGIKVFYSYMNSPVFYYMYITLSDGSAVGQNCP